MEMSVVLRSLLIAALIIIVPAISKGIGRYITHRRSFRYRPECYQLWCGIRSLLDSLEKEIKVAGKEPFYLRDGRFDVSVDRLRAVQIIKTFCENYNNVVEQGVMFDGHFKEVQVAEVKGLVDNGKHGVHIYITFEGNDVIRYFLPDYGLQSFITSLLTLNRLVTQRSDRN